ncbi:MAG: ribosomal protein S18-alanine N-acetyltransferase [Acidobacteriota bacterium]
MEIEHVAFSAPWSARAYDYELHYNEMAHYYVARPQGTVALAPERMPRENIARSERPSLFRRLFGKNHKNSTVQVYGPAPVVGYGGLWLMVDEAHISTIASHPDWRRRGIGELLLLAMIDSAAEIGANIVTLEVRVTNVPAQVLYTKYGFEVVGRRKGYYSDNGEDAYIMTTPSITTADFARRMQVLQASLFKRLAS